MNIHPIDLNFQGLPETIAAYLLQNGTENVLVETGPESTLGVLLQGLREHGVEPGQVGKVLLTHIHLDHAGAAGWWAGQGAQIFVHERGARHLADPARLLEGARAVYGDAMETLWGPVRPVPPEQLTALRDGDRLDLGAITLTAWDTPGHARHHLVFAGPDFAFTGDLTGVRLPGQRYISPTTAPSQFDPVAYDASLERLAAAGFERFYVTHFGTVETCEDHLARYRDLLRRVTELVRKAIEAGATESQVQEAVLAFNREQADEAGLNGPLWERYEKANPSVMAADGIREYWESQRSR